MTLGLFDTAAILIVVAAIFALANHHLLKLPFTIGLVVAGLAASATIVVVDLAFPTLGVGPVVRSLIEEIDFTRALMHGMLGFLLFAGALHVNLEDLLAKRTPVLALASVGLLLSTAIVGAGAYGVFRLLGIEVPLTYCFVFGALISPTDPIAVLGIMKSVGAPKSLETKVAGESLFNDGFGVVVFSLLLAAAGAGHGPDAHSGVSGGAVLNVFVREVVGGTALGFAFGFLTYLAMRGLEEPNLEVFLSVALVMAITVVAGRLHTSGPLACVIAGLLIGNRGRRLAMMDRTRLALDVVWSFIDEALNAVLFLLVGLEVLAISFDGRFVGAALVLIPVVLGARFLSVLVPVSVLRLRQDFSPGVVRILTWGGLKGAISVALALSLPVFPGREAVLAATYAVVIFSILVQGLTIGRLIRRAVGDTA